MSSIGKKYLKEINILYGTLKSSTAGTGETKALGKHKSSTSRGGCLMGRQSTLLDRDRNLIILPVNRNLTDPSSAMRLSLNYSSGSNPQLPNVSAHHYWASAWTLSTPLTLSCLERNAESHLLPTPVSEDTPSGPTRQRPTVCVYPC